MEKFELTAGEARDLKYIETDLTVSFIVSSICMFIQRIAYEHAMSSVCLIAASPYRDADGLYWGATDEQRAAVRRQLRKLGYDVGRERYDRNCFDAWCLTISWEN